MKFALVNGQHQEAQPNLSGKCPACGHPMVAKCGERRLRIWHWAHKSRRHCDPWWENETEWHRAWKGRFPAKWQESVHRAESGEKHIADVKTDQGWALEFQYSYLKPEERQARNAFYPKLAWIVNGTRRKRDKPQFFEALEQGTPIGQKPLVMRVSLDKCALLREWAGSRKPVFLDFGEGNESEAAELWCLFPKIFNRKTYVVPFSLAFFLKLHLAPAQNPLNFAKALKELSEIFRGSVSLRRAQTLKLLGRQPQHYRRRRRRPQSFRQYLSKQARARRRF
jgi:competence protein CoiA